MSTNFSYVESHSRRRFTPSKRDDKEDSNELSLKPYVSKRQRTSTDHEDTQFIPPPPKSPPPSLEDQLDETSFPPPLPPSEEPLKPSTDPKSLTVAERIRLKLSGKILPDAEVNKDDAAAKSHSHARIKERRDHRDPKIMAKIATPVIISSTVGHGISAAEAKRSIEEHKQKLMKWKYNMAVKASEQQKNKSSFKANKK